MSNKPPFWVHIKSTCTRNGKIRNIIMTEEEFIKSKVINDNGYEPHSCEMVAKADALRAIEMVRNEAINSVWHDASEHPTIDNTDIIIVHNNHIRSDFWCNFVDWNKFVRTTKLEYWAYVKDLLPKENEK